MTTFRHLNEGWNAEPNAPSPQVRVEGGDVIVSFLLNPFQFHQFGVEDTGILRFLFYYQAAPPGLLPSSPHGKASRKGEPGNPGDAGQFRLSDFVPEQILAGRFLIGIATVAGSIRDVWVATDAGPHIYKRAAETTEQE